MEQIAGIGLCPLVVTGTQIYEQSIKTQWQLERCKMATLLKGRFPPERSQISLFPSPPRHDRIYLLYYDRSSLHLAPFFSTIYLAFSFCDKTVGALCTRLKGNISNDKILFLFWSSFVNGFASLICFTNQMIYGGLPARVLEQVLKFGCGFSQSKKSCPER